MPLMREFKITSPFGMRKHPITGVYQLHEGIDLACNNEDVHAYDDGIVEQVGFHENLGYFIDVNHIYYMTRYQHLSAFRTAKGRIVQRKELIGISGNTGASTAPHLHFGIKVGKEWVDPMLFSPYEKIIVKVNGNFYNGLKDMNNKTYVTVRDTFEDLQAEVNWTAESGVEVKAKNIKDYWKLKDISDSLKDML